MTSWNENLDLITASVNLSHGPSSLPYWKCNFSVVMSVSKMKSPSFKKLSIVHDLFTLHFKLIMHFYCEISISISCWKKTKQTCPIQNEHVTIVCVSDQSGSQNARNSCHVVPHIWKPMTAAVTWANRYFWTCEVIWSWEGFSQN